MTPEVIPRQTPEERELDRKRVELAELEAQLADRELQLATIQAELHAFERRYVRLMSARYAELDDVNARIAEHFARLHPADKQAQQERARAWSRARESADQAGTCEQSVEPGFEAPEGLRKLYRQVAKAIHPDLATELEERARRTRLMTEANAAYAAGDEGRLEAILHIWQSSPDAVKGDGIASELVRTIRKIAQVGDRLARIGLEIGSLERSDLYLLRARADAAAADRRDLLEEMAALLVREIERATCRLSNLKSQRPS